MGYKEIFENFGLKVTEEKDCIVVRSPGGFMRLHFGEEFNILWFFQNFRLSIKEWRLINTAIEDAAKSRGF